MMVAEKRARINIYVSDPDLPLRVKLAALERRMTVSAFCEEAIQRAIGDGSATAREARRQAALETLKRIEGISARTVPFDVPISDLIHAGHDR